jgi:hypothetical protein
MVELPPRGAVIQPLTQFILHSLKDQLINMYSNKLKLSLSFFWFLILFNLFVTLVLTLQMGELVERYGPQVLVYFLWFKIIGSVLSFIGEYIFNFKSKGVFLRNIKQSPKLLLISIYSLDFILFLLLCLLIVLYI